MYWIDGLLLINHNRQLAKFQQKKNYDQQSFKLYIQTYFDY